MDDKGHYRMHFTVVALFDEVITSLLGPHRSACFRLEGAIVGEPDLALPFNHQIIFRLSYKTGKAAYWTLVQ
jgi:hypothetical protein